MFIQNKVSAAHLINKMMGGMFEIKDEEVEKHEFSEMECSAIKEVGNIITGAYLNADKGRYGVLFEARFWRQRGFGGNPLY